MRIFLFVCFVLSSSVVSAENKDGKNSNKNKIKRPGKLLGPNNVGYGTNTCFVNCQDPCTDGGCEVFDGGDSSLGTFYCKCNECQPGETGVGSFECNTSGIRDLNAEDTSASCGGDGFDISLLLGRADCETNGGDVSCPGTCQCESCDCNPCAEDEECVTKNGKFGGFQCK
eukprot:CAMPEP_0172554642 /NCGR_PEP_ID=MMETSP1067-20121228/55638_1 /TAXON_ID=265564 ORGANISM="Thalassiosira punctigera, Strain Tpunct2005C2" /NCGR_SAMPLE_ID=MMETSP1067 /ASSEMBLY_ACC=CAM_ASM_000444 /LENGTH=170 /DNA_ID=CAMNT_0013343053 /DNA_START=64 /DNA_END=576 /DNA_ORIENTATION=-